MKFDSPSVPVRHRRHLTVLMLAAIAGIAILLTGCSTDPRSGSAPATTPPSSVTLLTTTGAPGTYLTDGAGRALYMWDADRGGTSTCYGDCAAAWPPLTVDGQVTTGAGVQKSLIGSTTRDDGTQQVTYGGWPLYYFAQDVAPGELSGQGDTGFGAVWWVVDPSGNPLPSPVGS